MARRARLNTGKMEICSLAAHSELATLHSILPRRREMSAEIRRFPADQRQMAGRERCDVRVIPVTFSCPQILQPLFILAFELKSRGLIYYYPQLAGLGGLERCQGFLRGYP